MYEVPSTYSNTNYEGRNTAFKRSLEPRAKRLDYKLYEVQSTKFNVPSGDSCFVQNPYFKLFHGAARRGGYFYSISIIFLTLYLVIST